MATIGEVMRPYIEHVVPAGAEYSDLGQDAVKVTLPKIEHMSYRKTLTLRFEGHVVDAVMASEATADKTVVDRVGNYVCDRLAAKFEEMQGSNVQLTFLVGDEALDLV
jgi:hypothetical protein